MDTRPDRDEANQQTDAQLRETNEQLRLILDSMDAAIIGIDVDGRCTLINPSALHLLGYDREQDLLGENIHQKIHCQRLDGAPFPLSECRIYLSIREGRGFTADDEVFWRADGTPLQVEYRAFPQIRAGQVIGGVITFADITERKAWEQEVRYLNCRDALTGLLNRRCFMERVQAVDHAQNLPLTVIFADINGLKLTNDVFGHTAGDALIRKSADVLRASCRARDVLARTGGDEFIILLPRTDVAGATRVIDRIHAGFRNAQVAAIKCSISLGADTKTHSGQELKVVVANAENNMYRDKAVRRPFVNRDLIDHILDTLFKRSPREMRHANAVRAVAGRLGRAMALPPADLGKLERAAYLHDIGKIVLEDEVLLKDPLAGEEYARMQQHAVVGYRILSLFDDTLDLAEYIYGHHEQWDGLGYPRGIQGEQIPLISRILAVVEVYDRMMNRASIPLAERPAAAKERIRRGCGQRFDPTVARRFLHMLEQAEADGARYPFDDKQNPASHHTHRSGDISDV